MNAVEVKTHVSNIERALKEKLPPNHLIDLLNSLKKGVPATESLLRETKVGMAVNKLRAHNDKGVADLAKEIVGKWKKDVQKAKASGEGSKDKGRSASPATPLSPAAKKPEVKVATGPKVDPSKRNRKTDGVKYQCTGDKTRDNCVGTLYDVLCLDSDAPVEHILSLAKSLEGAVFKNHRSETNAPYKRRIQTLYLNIKDKKNPGLRRRVVSGELSTERLATMETSEMASEERRKEDEAIQKENLNNSMMAKAERSISDQLQCGKCGKKKVSYSQAQTRSADEPMTTFCTCEHCGHMWKFS